MKRAGDRLFLDANVLFSAAYKPRSRLLVLWSLGGTELVTSDFALEEARRNLAEHSPEALLTLQGLAERTTIFCRRLAPATLLAGVEVADKDAPILAAAIASGCTHLITGDARHFGKLFGRVVGGVTVSTPAQYLGARPRR